MADIERILIVGGGIAGLTVATAHRRGFKPELIERSAAWPAIGVGIFLPRTACGCCRRSVSAVAWPWRTPWCWRMSCARQPVSRLRSRPTFYGAGQEPAGCRRRAVLRHRPGPCPPQSVMSHCANGEIRCSATATGRSYLSHSGLSAEIPNPPGGEQ